MKEKQRKPVWWLLDGLVIFLVGLLIGVHRLYLATSVETLLQVLLILAFYGLVMLWLRANEAAISQEEQEKRRAMNPELHLTEIQVHYQQVMARYRERKD